jgi:hypothetical protein
MTSTNDLERVKEKGEGEWWRSATKYVSGSPNLVRSFSKLWLSTLPAIPYIITNLPCLSECPIVDGLDLIPRRKCSITPLEARYCSLILRLQKSAFGSCPVAQIVTLHSRQFEVILRTLG